MSFTFELVNKVTELRAELAAEQEKVRELEAELDRLAAGNSSMEKEIPQLRQSLRESQSGAAALREALERARCLAREGIALNIESIDKAISSPAGASLLARLAELEALVAGLEQDREKMIREGVCLTHDRARLMAALESLADSADVFMADQTGATDYRVGLVQPVSVSDCLKLNEDIAKAHEAIDQARTAEIERRKA